MNATFKYLIAVFATLLAHQASADVTIRLTGTKTARIAAHRAIVSMMGGEENCKFAHGSISDSTTNTQASYESSDYSITRGAVDGIDGLTTVQCSWYSSTSGIASVAAGDHIDFVSPSALPTSNGYSNANVSQSANQNVSADCTFSDVYQSSTLTVSPLSHLKLGVLPYCFVANKGTTGITNMTQQQACAIWTNGSQPKKLFTGSTSVADADDLVLAVGYNNSVGERVSLLAETKYGVFTPLQQWKLDSTGALGSGSIVSAQVWPVNDGVGSLIAGNGGYFSGSTIRNFMSMTSSSIELLDETGASAGSGFPVSLISWLGIIDANIAVTNGAVRLSYNGVTYDGTNPDLIYEGVYSAWSYLHFYSRTGLTSDQNQFRNILSDKFDGQSFISVMGGVPIHRMHVSRSNDGAVVGP